MWRSLMLTQLMLMLVVGLTAASQAINAPTIICKSMEISRLEEFDQLRDCTIVVGHVRIVNLDLPHIGANGTKENETSIAARIVSNVQEITDYLLVYRVNDLISLEGIFPQLRIIRGQALLFDEYSLVIYENRNLREIGLISLLRIQNGDVRVESNPMLCFVNTINWVYLFGDSTAQHYAINKENNSPNHCPVCDGLGADYSYHMNATKHCWNLKDEQLKPKRAATDVSCPSACGANGCDSHGQCCQRNCVTGCGLTRCELCGTYKHRSSNKCVESCVASFLLHKRECVSSRECRLLNLIPLGNECVERCPDNHRLQFDEYGQPHCSLNCSGHYVIRTGKDLAPLIDCVTIYGSIVFELTDVKEKIVDALSSALKSVQEITGYLKVQRSPQLVSLSFLKNLDNIRGDELVENKYALYVVDNHHLEHIWANNQYVAVQKGSVFFHLNPRLCYEKIIAMQQSIKSVQNISIADVSPNSNGERVICGRAVRELVATIEDYNATAVRISVDYMRSDALEILFGYIYSYKEAPVRNVTMYDGRHGCGHDDWNMDISDGLNRRFLISNLKPYTQYAVFVKTLTRTDYHSQIDFYSKIMYFRTLSTRPTPVFKIYGESSKSNELLLHWWPPRKPNGIITKYVVNYDPVKTDNDTSNMLPQPLDTDCECVIKQPYYSGPPPEDTDYYNKAQVDYEEALPNLIYVSRHRKAELAKLDKFPKVIDMAHIDVTTPKPKPPTTVAPAKTSISDQTYEEKKAQAERNYIRYRQQYEIKAKLAQDNGPETLPIEKPPRVCEQLHASVEYQRKNNCSVAVEVEAKRLVPGTQHSLLISHLEPNQTYRISVQACVGDVVDGCSNPTSILAETISHDFEEFLESLHDLL